MHVLTIISLPGALLALAACVGSTTYYEKPGGAPRDFEIAQAQCRMGAAQLPQYRSPRPAPSYSAQTQIVGSTAYSTIQENNGLASGLADFSDALHNVAKRDQYINDCLIAQGWLPASAPQDRPPNIQYDRAPPAFRSVEDYTLRLNNDVDMRSEPFFNGDVVHQLSSGDDVVVFEESSGSWGRVRAASGRSGYIPLHVGKKRADG